MAAPPRANPGAQTSLGLGPLRAPGSGPAAAPPVPPPSTRGAPPLPAAGSRPPVDANRDDLPAGIVIGSRYEALRRIGKGGMGTVYAVRHVNTGEELALKLLNPSLAENATTVERFRTEARAPVRIGTESVVRVVDADVSAELGGVPYLVMELLKGRDLGTELKRRGALPAGEVCLYLKQVGRTLDKAHSIGITHRDMKPANLFLTERDDGSPLIKVLDFGIAKLTDGTASELTQDGTIFGTPWYMAPEQARGQASKVGPASDLWALGLIAYRLLTGRNYWTAEGMAGLIGQILYEPMPPPSETAPHLGPLFDVWFSRACDREPERRFTSASDQIRELAKALGVSYESPTTNAGDLSQSQPSQPSGSIQIPVKLQQSAPGHATLPSPTAPLAGTSMADVALPTSPSQTAEPVYSSQPGAPPTKRPNVVVIASIALLGLSAVAAIGMFALRKPSEPSALAPATKAVAEASALPTTTAPANTEAAKPAPPPAPEPAATNTSEPATPAPAMGPVKAQGPAKPAASVPVTRPSAVPAAAAPPTKGPAAAKPSAKPVPKVGNINF